MIKTVLKNFLQGMGIGGIAGVDLMVSTQERLGEFDPEE